MSDNKIGKKINILSGIESDILNMALYALFTFVIMTTGTMGSITAAGLSEREAMTLYYVREIFLLAGYLIYSLTDHRITDRFRKICIYLSGVVFLFGVLGTIIFPGTYPASICILVCMFAAGILGAFTLKLIALKMRTPFAVCFGGSAAVLLQWIFQLNDKLTFLTPVILIVSFAAVIVLERVADKKDSKIIFYTLFRKEDVPGFLIRMMIIVVCLYAFFPFYEVYASGMLSGSFLYNVPRLFLIAGYIVAGILFSLKKRNHPHLGVLCMAILSLLLPILSSLEGATFAATGIFYAILGYVIAYCNICFLCVAPATKKVAFWASMGRIADLTVTIAVGGLIYVTGVSYLAAFIAELILLITLIALMFTGNLLRGDLVGDEVTDRSDISSSTLKVDPVTEYSLTPREKEVFDVLISTEKKNQEIADDLGISRRQLQNHIASIYKKTGTQSRAGLTQLTK